MTRVLLFGTHPKQFNGYSKVVYEICKRLCKREDVQVGIFGFQNFYANNQQHREDLPQNVFIHDAFANENPKGTGFGINQIISVVNSFKPDVCIVYNDMMIINHCINELEKVENRTFKIIAYVDQVYLNQKKQYIEYLNQKADLVMLFSSHWEKLIIEQGVKKQTTFLPHGFDSKTYYRFPKHLARDYLGMNQQDFIILNLNRNQPRKRWDICLKAFAEIVHKYPKEPIKLLIATAIQGAWNLLEIFERELNKRGVSLEDGLKHIIIIDNPQKLTDFDVNVMYNASDIGINTCDGEGWGLCNFEPAALGIPQVVPRLGGFIDFLNDDCCMMADPKLAYYVDNSRDMVCGEALMTDYMDYVLAIEQYYFNKQIYNLHSERLKSIPNKYRWDNIVDKLYGIVKNLVGTQSGPGQTLLSESNVIPIQIEQAAHSEEKQSHIPQHFSKIDIEQVKNIFETPDVIPSVNERSPQEHIPPKTEKTEKKKHKIKTNRSKSSSDDKIMTKKELLKLRSKLDEVLKTIE